MKFYDLNNLQLWQQETLILLQLKQINATNIAQIIDHTSFYDALIKPSKSIIIVSEFQFGGTIYLFGQESHKIRNIKKTNIQNSNQTEFAIDFVCKMMVCCVCLYLKSHSRQFQCVLFLILQFYSTKWHQFLKK